MTRRRLRGAWVVWRNLYAFQELRGWRRIYWTFVNWNRMGRGRDWKS